MKTEKRKKKKEKRKKKKEKRKKKKEKRKKKKEKRKRKRKRKKRRKKKKNEKQKTLHYYKRSSWKSLKLNPHLFPILISESHQSIFALNEILVNSW